LVSQAIERNGLAVTGSKRALPAGQGRQLAGLILAESGRAGLRPGARLPTERRLAADLGVTRSGIRLALAALEADGLISREVGRGTFLSEAAGPALAALAEQGPGGQALGDQAQREARPADFAPADVMTIRRLLEPQAMPLVVLWATARDFGEMERCVAGGDHAASYEEFEAWDLALHRCIIAAAHSPLLSELYSLIESARHGPSRGPGSWGDLKRRSASAERRAAYQRHHWAIVAALRARDADASTEAMRLHLSVVAEHLLGESR
jgi:GntR family transcriptional regulator, uxu operon transcriptional repressor